MSRIAKRPIVLPKDTTVSENNGTFTVSGPKGSLSLAVNPAIEVSLDGSNVSVAPAHENISPKVYPMIGTTYVLLSNMIKGVTSGFEKKLKLVGVGYRAKVNPPSNGMPSVLEMSLGKSHPVLFEVPEGINITVPAPTEVVVQGIDKQKVGQVASNIRFNRVPENYKGKGIRYEDERVLIKETKKKK